MRDRTIIPLLTLILVACTLTACGTINSGLNIPPGQEFRLGENRHGAFTVVATNGGNVPVVLLEQAGLSAADAPTPVKLTTLAPGATAEQQYGANTVAIFRNDTNAPARLDVRIVGDTNLTMGYAGDASLSPDAEAGP